jgi:hypothetical protein
LEIYQQMKELTMGEIKSTLDLVLERTKHLVLDHCCHLDYDGLADLINKYQAGCHAAAKSRREALKESLARKYNISGSAVVPNLESDEKWHLEAQAMLSTVKEELNQEKVKMVGS